MPNYVLMINLDGTWVYVRSNKGYCFTENKMKAKTWKKISSAEKWFEKSLAVFKSHLSYQGFMISEQ